MRLADALLLLYEKGDCATHVAVSGVAGRPFKLQRKRLGAAPLGARGMVSGTHGRASTCRLPRRAGREWYV